MNFWDPNSQRKKIFTFIWQTSITRKIFFQWITRNDFVCKINSIDYNHTSLKNVKSICFKPSTFIKGLVCWGDKRGFHETICGFSTTSSKMYWRTIALVFRFRNTFWTTVYLFQRSSSSDGAYGTTNTSDDSKYNANKMLQWYLLEYHTHTWLWKLYL